MKLLICLLICRRAIEEKVVIRVGDTKPIHSDFRIISATNVDIEENVNKKKFRLDLLHRLNTLHIHIPPLRERRSDIKPLLSYFINYFKIKFNKPYLKFDNNIFKVLMKYDFPGNVRELRNMVERAVILCQGQLLGSDDFPIKSTNTSMIENNSDSLNLKSVEISLIKKALKATKYNQKSSAEILGISRDALIRKMRKHEINKNSQEESSRP
jgi:transcriptional regulator with PAS, ATPase and Fis domain